MEKVGIFISIPKCASKTILNMFELGRNRDIDKHEKKNNYIIFENHQRLSVLEKDYNINDLFIFTFVRNPYDRCVSWFSYHKNIDLEEYKNLSLNEWVKQGCKTHWKRQNKTNWIKENKSPLLQYNFIEGNKKIDFIGKIENFENDCKEIIEILNMLFEKNKINKHIVYKHIKANASNNKEILSDESKEIIYTLFKKDFEYFNYDK
jgi:hypothetical protein